MISRGHMRRQLRARGGITNARQGYGIGSWVKERIRKIIPNELASVASKAAPFVAMLPGYGPAAAGLMRGIGRFDKRGSISDALKQGVGTYAGGKLFDKGMQGLDLRGTDGSAIKSLKELPGKFMEKGSDLLKAPSTAKEILKNQLIIGGGTALVSLISQGLIDEPEQEAGESINNFMARRKESVSKQLKTYLGNTNKFRGMSDVELDALVAQNMTEYDKDFASGSGGYNQGGRVGYQTGGISMTNTAAQNRAINNARRTQNQGVLQAARNKIKAPTQPPITQTQLTQMTNTPVGTATPSGVISVMPQLSNNNSPTNNFYTPSGTNPYGMVANTGIPRGPNGGYIIDGVEYMSEQEAIDAMGLERYNQLMSKGGRVGLANGSDDMVLPMKKPEVERMLTYEEAKALDPQMFVDTTTSAYGAAVPEGTPTLEKVFELEVDEIAKVILGTRSSPREKGEIQDTETMSSKDFMKNAYLIPKVKELSENYGYSEAEILKMIKNKMMTYSKPKKEMMNKGGLMGLNRIGFGNGSGGSSIKLLDGTVVQIPLGAIGPYGLKDIIYSSSKGDLTKDEIVPLLVPSGASYNKGGRVGLANGSGIEMAIEENKALEDKIDLDKRRTEKLKKMIDDRRHGKFMTPFPNMDNPLETKRLDSSHLELEEGDIKNAPYDPSTREDDYIVFDDGTVYYKDTGEYYHEDFGEVIGPGLGAKPIPKTVEAAKGGLMRLNYMIGGEAKQMEAGAPPIMYSGNMDPNAPNQQVGLPSTPGPMQMAEDGPEFDMRENGGFQPLGRQEGKDDVPAMLAKNEFVMTADAVRAAGGGSIQKGAQKMYDTMKKLESRVS